MSMEFPREAFCSAFLSLLLKLFRWEDAFYPTFPEGEIFATRKLLESLFNVGQDHSLNDWEDIVFND